MEAYRSVIMEAFTDRVTASELLSYKEVLFEEATEEWYAQRDPGEVDREEYNCIRLAEQFWHLIQRPVIHLCTPSLANAKHSSTSRELPLAHALHITAG